MLHYYNSIFTVGSILSVTELSFNPLVNYEIYVERQLSSLTHWWQYWNDAGLLL